MEYTLVNVMEDKVLTIIKKAAPELKCCTGNACKMELAAYVLNQITPKYVDTEKGALFTRANHMSSEFDMKILLSVSAATAAIGKIPHQVPEPAHKLLNVMEGRVFHAIDETLPQLGCCTCDRCRADVAAYTLSRIKPYYIAVEEGKPLPDLTGIGAEHEGEILQIIVQAADIVSSKPNHS